ncbi:MAG: TMEM175 family protein [Chitinophagales bacterium]
MLVLDIHVPVVKSGESLLQGLLANWETYLAFLVGFFTLLVCWINLITCLSLFAETMGCCCC